MAQNAKNLRAMQKTQFLSLCWEDPLEKGMATHSRILFWRSPSIEEPGGYTPWGCKELYITEQITDLVLLAPFHGNEKIRLREAK